MTANLLDGKLCSQAIKERLRIMISSQSSDRFIRPGLAVILVGEDAASKIYVERKKEACEEVGIESFSYNLPDTTSQKELLQLIDNLNKKSNIHGILVQLPLPKKIQENSVLEHIIPHKDIDGFHPYNLGRLAQRRPALRPCTPFGIMKLLEFYNINPKGKHCVVVGASNIVGRPMSLELLLAGATVTICHKFTQNLAAHVKDADILVVATGKRNIIATEWLKPGSIIIDVGIHRLPSGQVVGDLDFEGASKVASYITPVPGGVGPMTVAMLLWNTVEAAGILT